MLKIKDIYINLKKVLYIETSIQKPNCYNDYTEKYVIKFIFGENYSYQVSNYKDIRGYNQFKESESSKRTEKAIYFTNEEEFNEILSELDKVKQ